MREPRLSDAPMTAGRGAVRPAFLLAALVVALATVLATLGPAANATPARARTAGTANPLAGHRWGVYTGGADGLYPAYLQAKHRNQTRKMRLLAKEALRPRVRWFGGWIPASQIGDKVSSYIAQAQNGNPDVVVQMAMFRLFPDGEGRKDDPITSAEQQSYRSWVDHAASAIGSARVAMVLEPDLGVSLKGWRPAVRLRLARYAAQRFGSLPNASVYLDASDSDWLKVPVAVRMLKRAGVQDVRGFALGATHYTGTAADIAYGTRIVNRLAKAGIPDRHFVIDTADNGHPFTWLWYWRHHRNGDFNNAETCSTRTQHHCDTLGIPPTTRVGAKRWHLPHRARRMARRHVDAYLWFSRPWLTDQKGPFSMQRALAVARTTPY